MAVAAFAATVVATFIVTTAATATVASATAAFATHQFNQFLNFFVSSRTAFDDFTFKNQVGTGQRVIEVNYYNVRFDFHYAGVHTLAIASLQRYDVTFFDVFAIEFTVNFEDMFRKVDNVLFVILSVCFICRNGKIEFITFGKRSYLVFEVFESCT